MALKKKRKIKTDYQRKKNLSDSDLLVYGLISREVRSYACYI